MNLKLLLALRKDKLESIRENREKIVSLTKENQVKRKEYISVQQKILKIVERRMERGETLYEICINEFGKVDENFFVLYKLFPRP